MKWLFLACGVVLGALAGVSAMIFLQPHDDQIIFAPKHFYNTEAAVVASGTLTGPNLAYPNNYYTIACYQDRKECVISRHDPLRLGFARNPQRIHSIADLVLAI